MAALRPEFCLVCDALRRELPNKFTVLGLYGICPHVDLSVIDPARPTQLSFLILGLATASGVFTVTVGLSDPRGKEIGHRVVEHITISDQGPKRVNFVLDVNGLHLSLGQYTINFNVDGEDYPFTFRVNKGSEEEYKRLSQP